MLNRNLSHRLFLVSIVLFLLAAACSMPVGNSTPAPQNAQTQSVQTLSVLMTQVAGNNTTAQPGGQATSPSSQASATPWPTVTLAPSSTPLPTATHIVIPTNTATPVCDLAGFVSDVSIPDGTAIPAGSTFNKTWRIKNLGACTWSKDYSVVFDSGDSMSGPSSQKIGASVAPGETIDITVALKAPSKPAAYRGNWKLKNVSGVLFGLSRAAEPFYVDIKVTASPNSSYAYDFTANYCLAEWSGNGKALPCTGTDGSTDGFVLYQAAPKLENGQVDNEPALLTNPPKVTDGVIRGKYPAFTVKTNDKFIAIVGCEYNAKNCSVRFQLDYQIDNGAIQTIASWNEAYEGQFQIVTVDLNPLAGKNVKFILTVLANGASDGDRAQWLAPRIVNRPPPTPTFTPTATKTPEGYPYPAPSN